MDQALTDARCPMHTKIIDGSSKFGTTTIGAARYAYVPYNFIPTLEDMTHTVGGVTKQVFVPVEQYAAAGKIADGEVGKIGKVRFIAVEDMPILEGQGGNAEDDAGGDDSEAANRFTSGSGENDSNYDVFPVLFVGNESFATVDFEKSVGKLNIARPQAIAKVDPFGKLGSISADWYFGLLMLRPEWVRVIYSCAING